MKPEEKIYCPNCEDVGELNGEYCRACCEHEFEDYYCLNCGEEQDPGELIDAAEAWFDMER